MFTPAERNRIKNFPEPDVLLWALWAGKEAAYKVLVLGTSRTYESIHPSAIERALGVKAYKEAEKKAMKVMEQARAPRQGAHRAVSGDP